jgi:hypothetical protein
MNNHNTRGLNRMIGTKRQRSVKIRSMRITSRDENGETVIKDITSTHNVREDLGDVYVPGVTRLKKSNKKEKTE